MNRYEFTRKRPEETGIDSKWVVNFLTRLEKCQLPLHSFILMKDDAVVAETYYAPYKADTQHRMFSVIKSFVSIGIGLLEEEGKLSLDDKIVSYFPEKLNGEPHPYLAQMTIRDVLMMSSCHAQTTYKFAGCTDWTGSFFTTKPSHVPGTTFSYDTSATHTMCALVEKLSGKSILDYLKDKFLNEIGFSEESYVMVTEYGESYGGSGLMCTPMDLLKFIRVIANDGKFNDKQLLPEAYVKAATSWQTDTYGKSGTWEEMQGYGYQFWRTTHNGFACYGMGGQYAVYYPDYNVFFVTTADTQGRQGGTQLIYDAFYQEILDKIGEEIILELAPSEYDNFLSTRTLFHIEGKNTSPIVADINNCRYNMDPHPKGFKWMSLSLNEDNGVLDYETDKGVFSLPFGIGANKIVEFPHYGYKAAVSGAFRREDTFLIKAHLVDECIGNVTIQLVFKDNDVTVMMRKVEETMFNEFDGFLCGHRE